MAERTPEGSTAIIVGIDEAGYGPLLGPLVVSAVAFEIPLDLLNSAKDPAEGPDLWEAMRSAVIRKHSRKNPRLAVADSKQLHGKVDTEHGIQLLERAALTFLAQADRHPASLEGLLRIICPHVIEQLPRYPWYCDPQSVSLPAECGAADIAIQRNALTQAMNAAGIRFRGAWVEALPEGHFNQMCSATHNKAVVLFTQNIRLIQRIAQSVGPVPLHIWADRHGGRTAYLRPLMTAFADASFEVLEESPDRSCYRVTRGEVPSLIRYVTKGETHQLPIALASIFSKYVRELFMICFNRYWLEQMPELRPTAGYSQDGRRFLADIEALIARHGVDRQWLVRAL